MYIPVEMVLESIRALSCVHPFHGITFLACKKRRLPISSVPIEFRVDAATKEHMDEFHRLCPYSGRYYQPFGALNPKKRWVNPDYASSGLQRINTSTFRLAFNHESRRPLWSWSETYVDVMAANLYRGARIPAFEMSVWLYHRRDVGDRIDGNALVGRFFEEYQITEEEKDRLFDTKSGANRGWAELATSLSRAPATWSELRQGVPYPPDVSPEGGSALQSLEVSGCGPVTKFDLRPAEHLTLITGDNGLGKTFLLECAWFALTGTWAGTPAAPRESAARDDVWLRYSIGGRDEFAETESVRFDWNKMDWNRSPPKPHVEAGLILYARVDGSFSIWDPIKAKNQHSMWSVRNPTYTSSEVWDGRPSAMEGIVRDWSRWQNSANPESYEKFVKILEDLSPSDLGTLAPGDLTRIHGDPREIPTIRHRYGEVPILFASAGVKRVIAIAYLLVWAWEEHQVAARQMKRRTEQRMVVMVDEVEAHLHPRWQRQVLPALTSVVGRLSSDLAVQIIVTTHAPLILASAEPTFVEEEDVLLHLRLKSEGTVVLEEIEFAKQGDVGQWLTSSTFDLKQARSRESEVAIEEAKRLQVGRDAPTAEVKKAHEELRRVLGPDDQFWLRWLAFAENAGIEL